MYEKYFAEFCVSEEQLKEQIYDTLSSLIACSPKQWSENLLEHADPQKSSEEILIHLANHIPQIKAKQSAFNSLYTEDSLREVAITLDSILTEIQLEFFFLRQLYSLFINQFLGIRYFVASIIILKKFTEGLKYDSDKICSYLMDRTLDVTPLDLFVSARLATEEIDRVALDKKEGPSFKNFINEFEASIENDIKKNLNEIIKESLFRAYAEAFMKNVNLVNDFLQLNKTMTNADLKTWSKSIMKVTNELSILRLEIKDGRGGAHNVKEFAFKGERLVKFYNTVENLPKIPVKHKNGEKEEVPLWDYALDKLIENDFDSLSIRQLKERLVLHGISDSLFDRAVKTWRKYLDDADWNKMEEGDTARAFAFLHALELLGYKNEYEYSSLYTYYCRGKKLQEKSDFQS